MSTTKKRSLCLALCAAVWLSHCTTASAEMIYRSSFQSVSGLGTQLDPKEKSSTGEMFFRNDLINTGYVRDENNKIVGTVSSFASQTSAISESQVRGLGRGSGFANGPAEGVGKSELRVEFQAESAMTFTLSGQLRLAPHSLGLNGSTALVSLTGPEGVVFEVRLDDEHPPDELGVIDFMGANRLRGEFSAGDYILEAVAVGHGSGGMTRCVDFDFTLNAVDAIAVPEPATIYAMMCALGLILARLRRSR